MAIKMLAEHIAVNTKKTLEEVLMSVERSPRQCWEATYVALPSKSHTFLS